MTNCVPYSFGVTPSAWTADVDAEGPEAVASAVRNRDRDVCQMCGDENPVAPSLHHMDGDHDRWEPENLALVCLLCHMTQHWNRPTIDQEMALIWAPWIAQPDLNTLVKGIHQVFHRHGEHPGLGVTPASDAPTLCAAYRTYRALAAQEAEAERIIGSTSLSRLGAVLLGLGGKGIAVNGLRLLHKGRHFRKGRDVYPDLLGDPLPRVEVGR